MDFVDVEWDINVTPLVVERVGFALQNLKSVFVNVQPIERSDSVSQCVARHVDINYLRSLNPKEWKDHDHYAVLGLDLLRFDSTEDDIRRAFRKMVLLHHPDKRKAKGEHVDTENDYFTCITKSYEILGSPKSRRAFDSVDPEFNNDLPTSSEIEHDYYKTFNKYFKLNARWSERKDVPQFGNDYSKREDVDRFYTFWYDFKSWREFSYLDEEDKDKGQDREERRWIEKENKAARIKRKKEEMQRIRLLVDLAYNNDKRIQRFKNEEKERKLAAKRAKIDALQAQRAEQERIQREAQLAKEHAEKAEQKRMEQKRAEKEQMKKAVKREKKTLRDRAKEANYYGEDDKEILKHMEGVEKICETFSLSEMQELNRSMFRCTEENRDIFIEALQTAEEKIQQELEGLQQSQHRKSQKSDVKVINKNEVWNNETVQLLIKAVNLFPAGTTQRWDVIAAFINQHAGNTNSSVNITARDVLNKAKSLQNGDFSKNHLKAQANREAFEKFEKSKRDVQTCSDITVNNFSHENTNGTCEQSITENKSSAAPLKMNGTETIINEPQQKQKPQEQDQEHKQKQQKQKKQQQQQKQQNNNNNNNLDSNDKEINAKLPGASLNNSGAGASRAWTKEEQVLLEQAIKTYDSSTPDRWERIASCIPNRSKKDCLRRVKELVDRVNLKREAQQAVK